MYTWYFKAADYTFYLFTAGTTPVSNHWLCRPLSQLIDSYFFIFILPLNPHSPFLNVFSLPNMFYSIFLLFLKVKILCRFYQTMFRHV